MPVAVHDAARFTFAQLKERGDEALAKAQETLRVHQLLSRETHELHAEIDRLHHRPKALRH